MPGAINPMWVKEERFDSKKLPFIDTYKKITYNIQWFRTSTASANVAGTATVCGYRSALHHHQNTLRFAFWQFFMMGPGFAG
jgi:hypothetical protein